jgi:formate hydrogenlyase transcriptional activator
MQETFERAPGKPSISVVRKADTRQVVNPATQIQQIIEQVLHTLTEPQDTAELIDGLQQYKKQLREAADKFSTELERQVKSAKGFLDFERMISDLYSRVINIAPEEVDAEIHHCLHQLCVFFQASHCGFMEVSLQVKSIKFSHIACLNKTPQIPLQVDVSGLYPWCFQNLIEKRQIVDLTASGDIPAAAGIDMKTMNEWGVRSILFIPLACKGKVDHLLFISSENNESPWSEAYISRLKLLGEIIMNAIERRQKEETLSYSEQRFKQFFKNTPDYCYILSLEGSILNVNHAALQALGYQRKELVGKSEELIYSSESRTKLRDLFSRLKKTGEIKNEEMSIITRNQENRDVLLNATVLRNQKGNIKYYMAVQTDITDRKISENNLREAHAKIKQMKEQLEAENVYLKKEIELGGKFKDIIGESKAIKSTLHRVEQVAPTDTLVLITGKTGTGKELIAQAIHNNSRRKDRVMVKINCASLPAGLIESELFGRERGAYTGAMTRQVGRFQLADGSTIFLDEIGELSPEVQAKLLRVLQNGEFERLGSTRTIKVNVRIITATNRDLAEEVRKGHFREDLYYRLNVFPIEVPPLRERMEDIPLLVWAFIDEFSEKMNKKIHSIPMEVIEGMQSYHWPGNIRELRNVIEQAVITSRSGNLQIQLPKQPFGETYCTLSLEEAETLHIKKILELTGWRIKGRRGAAELLGLKPSTLYSRLNKLGIANRPKKGEISS